MIYMVSNCMLSEKSMNIEKLSEALEHVQILKNITNRNCSHRNIILVFNYHKMATKHDRNRSK
jgi:hypothetical protein